jgi:hypothetical protein
MYKAVTAVVPLEDYRVLLTFAGGERRVFDMSPYLGKGVFTALRERAVFDAVRISFDTIAWPNGADLCPELLYAESKPAAPDAGFTAGAAQTCAGGDAAA